MKIAIPENCDDCVFDYGGPDSTGYCKLFKKANKEGKCPQCLAREKIEIEYEEEK